MARVVRVKGRSRDRTEEAPGAGNQLTPLGAVYRVTEEQSLGSQEWGWNGSLSLVLEATFLF